MKGIQIISGVYAIPNSKYTIDTDGEVMSYNRYPEGKKMKNFARKDLYKQITLTINKIIK